MKRFHFSLGNSTDGPIGYCAAVYANSPEEAVGILKQELEDLNAQDGAMISDYGEPSDPDAADATPGIAYVQAYLNPEKVSVADIDEEITEEDGLW